jgi:hypothetical protein
MIEAISKFDKSSDADHENPTDDKSSLLKLLTASDADLYI